MRSTPRCGVRPRITNFGVRIALSLILISIAFSPAVWAAAPLGQTISLNADSTNLFVSADQNLGATAPLVADRPAVGTWEQFQVVDAGGGNIAFRSVGTGNYVSADQNLGANAPLVADRTAIGTWEEYQWIDVAGGQVQLKNVGNGKFVSADLNLGTNAPLAANRTAASTWETFSWAVVGGSGGGTTPNFGPNVLIFNPGMSSATIQSQINSVYSTQQNNQFGNARNALLFTPGSYGVDIPIGFYTEVAGLGASPNDVHIVGNVHADPTLPNNNATQTFWRAAENFSVTPSSGTMQWAVSQAAPFRRMHVEGNMVLHQNGGFASGGWMSDDLIDGNVNSGPQQQWIARNSQWGSWTGANWNMVFVGDVNPPPGAWPNPDYTEVAQVPVVREKPYLQVDSSGNYSVFVPSLRTNSSGITWTSGTAGTAIPISQFYIAQASVDTAATINTQLAAGMNLILTPGVYNLTQTIQINRANTVVLGMGFATLLANNGVTAMSVADVDGVILAGLFFDAGATSSPNLLVVGPNGSSATHAPNPTSLHDVFFRVGGAAVGKAAVNLTINSNNTIVDHTWIWRADHGTGVGWTSNTSNNGLIVNGNNVTIYGLFVEHFQQFQVLWNGNGGRTYFYQSEIPYDPPSQASYTSAAGTNGWASYKVASTVTSHEAWGLGIYSVFSNPNIFVTRAIEVPNTTNVKLHDMITVCIGGNGGISNVINGTGGATGANVSFTPKVTNFP
jgi:hypothetical protein